MNTNTTQMKQIKRKEESINKWKMTRVKFAWVNVSLDSQAGN